MPASGPAKPAARPAAAPPYSPAGADGPRYPAATGLRNPRHVLRAGLVRYHRRHPERPQQPRRVVHGGGHVLLSAGHGDAAAA